MTVCLTRNTNVKIMQSDLPQQRKLSSSKEQEKSNMAVEFFRHQRKNIFELRNVENHKLTVEILKGEKTILKSLNTRFI